MDIKINATSNLLSQLPWQELNLIDPRPPVPPMMLKATEPDEVLILASEGMEYGMWFELKEPKPQHQIAYTYQVTKYAYTKKPADVLTKR